MLCLELPVRLPSVGLELVRPAASVSAWRGCAPGVGPGSARPVAAARLLPIRQSLVQSSKTRQRPDRGRGNPALRTGRRPCPHCAGTAKPPAPSGAGALAAQSLGARSRPSRPGERAAPRPAAGVSA